MPAKELGTTFLTRECRTLWREAELSGTGLGLLAKTAPVDSPDHSIQTMHVSSTLQHSVLSMSNLYTNLC